MFPNWDKGPEFRQENTKYNEVDLRYQLASKRFVVKIKILLNDQN